MKLANAAIYFDNDPFLDGYTGTSLFSGQTASYDDSSSDGATIRRRVLSVAPSVTMPTRRVVSLYGDRWLVGTGTPDGFQGSVIRQHFSMKRVTDLMAVLTPAQALSAASGTPAYTQKMYFKDTVNSLTDAEYDTFWNVYLAPSETVVKGTFLRDASSVLYRVRGTYLPPEGLRVAQADELDSDAVKSCVFNTGAYNPTTDAFAAGSSTVSCIWLDMPKLFRFRHVSEAGMQAGDRAVLVPTSVTPVPNMVFTMDSLRWRVLSVQAELDAWVVHARLT
jgi:hypothetical protein